MTCTGLKCSNELLWLIFAVSQTVLRFESPHFTLMYVHFTLYFNVCHLLAYLYFFLSDLHKKKTKKKHLRQSWSMKEQPVSKNIFLSIYFPIPITSKSKNKQLFLWNRIKMIIRCDNEKLHRIPGKVLTDLIFCHTHFLSSLNLSSLSFLTCVLMK